MAVNAVATRHRFDQWARAYDGCALQPLYQRAHHGVLRAATVSGLAPRRVLDIGCGTGWFLRAAHRAFRQAALVGVDASTEMLDAARDVAPPATLVKATAELLPLADASFDLVTAIFTVRHWIDPATAFTEVHRILAPQGRLVIADAFSHTRPRPRSRGNPLRSLPPPWPDLVIESGLRPRTVEAIDGFGPVPVIAVINTEKQQASHRSRHRVRRH